ncbi:hypothetical protein MJO28_015783, partial [Puccinia striiformis f. sp. tritici]
MKPECLEPTFKSGRSSTSIWGAFFGGTKIPIVFLQSGGTKAVDHIDQVYKERLSLEQMKEAIQQAWDNIPAKNLRNLVKSMPNQMCLVVEAS